MLITPKKIFYMLNMHKYILYISALHRSSSASAPTLASQILTAQVNGDYAMVIGRSGVCGPAWWACPVIQIVHLLSPAADYSCKISCQSNISSNIIGSYLS